MDNDISKRRKKDWELRKERFSHRVHLPFAFDRGWKCGFTKGRQVEHKRVMDEIEKLIETRLKEWVKKKRKSGIGEPIICPPEMELMELKYKLKALRDGEKK